MPSNRKNEGEVQYEGRTYTWRREKRLLIVSDGMRSKTTQVTGANEQALALLIAAELNKERQDKTRQ